MSHVRGYRKPTSPRPLRRACFGAAAGIGIVSLAVVKFGASHGWWLAVPFIAAAASVTRPYPERPLRKFREMEGEPRPFLYGCIGALWGLGMAYIAMKLDASPWWWSAVPIVALLASMTSAPSFNHDMGGSGDSDYGSDGGDSGSSDSSS